MLVKNFCIKLHPLSLAMTALKIILLYVEGCEKRRLMFMCHRATNREREREREREIEGERKKNAEKYQTQLISI